MDRDLSEAPITCDPEGASSSTEITWRRPMSRCLDGVLRAYQRWLSPLLPPACRFHPSCSHYARQSLAEHPIHRALGLICWRLLRCQPLCAGGHDPVPPRSGHTLSPS